MIKKYFGAASPFRLSPGWMTTSYILLIIWTIIVLFPLYWLLTTPFKSPGDVNDGPKFIPWVDYQPTLDAWNYLLPAPTSSNIVPPPYLNTFVVGTTSAFLSLLLGAAPAYPLLRFHSEIKVAYIA